MHDAYIIKQMCLVATFGKTSSYTYSIKPLAILNEKPSSAHSSNHPAWMDKVGGANLAQTLMFFFKSGPLWCFGRAADFPCFSKWESNSSNLFISAFVSAKSDLIPKLSILFLKTMLVVRCLLLWDEFWALLKATRNAHFYVNLIFPLMHYDAFSCFITFTNASLFKRGHVLPRLSTFLFTFLCFWAHASSCRNRTIVCSQQGKCKHQKSDSLAPAIP